MFQLYRQATHNRVFSPINTRAHSYDSERLQRMGRASSINSTRSMGRVAADTVAVSVGFRGIEAGNFYWQAESIYHFALTDICPEVLERWCPRKAVREWRPQGNPRSYPWICATESQKQYRLARSLNVSRSDFNLPTFVAAHRAHRRPNVAIHIRRGDEFREDRLVPVARCVG